MVKKILFLSIFLLIILIPNLQVNAIQVGSLNGLNITQNENGTNIQYSLINDYFSYTQGTTRYIFSHSDNLMWKGISVTSADEYTYTTNLNYYFTNPCGSSDNVSYNQRIAFFFVNTDTYPLNTLNVVNNINGCSGYWTKEDSTYFYNQSCSLPAGSSILGSLYFSEPNLGSWQVSNYRIGIQDDFDVKCEVNTNALVDNNNANTQNIINNNINNTNQIIQDNQQNTQDIIDNQNQNTQDVIDNQNQNTQDVIDNNNNIYGNKCYQNLFNYTTISGVADGTNNNGVITGSTKNNATNNINLYFSQSISVSSGETIYLSCDAKLNDNSTGIFNNINDGVNASTVAISKPTLTNEYQRYTFALTYSNQTNISRLLFQILNLTGSVTIKNIMISKSNSSSYVPFGEEKCFNKLDEQTDAINGLNDTLSSESPPNTSSSLNDMNNSVASDTPISDLVTMPLTLLNAYINGIDSSCTNYNLGNLLGTDLVLPCINISNLIGSQLWSIIDILVSIFLIFNISKLFISAFDSLTSLKDNFGDLYYHGKHEGGDN